MRGGRTLYPSLKQLSRCARLGDLTFTVCLSSSTSTQVATVAASPKVFLAQKFKNVMVWYEEVTGLKEVRLSQEKVLKAEDRFIAAQDNRRDVSKQLAVVREKLKDIYAELEQTSRGEDRYVTLVTQENRVLKDERRLADLFNRYEQEERENFSMLSSAVKESHEKERIQAERTKYWSIIGSIIGTMLGIFGSSINNEFKMRELRKLVKESAQATLATRQEADLPKELLIITKNVKDVTEKMAQERNSVLVAMQERNKFFESQIYDLQKMIENKVVTADGTVFNIDQFIVAQQRENRILALICLSSVVGMFVVSKVFS